MDFHEQSRTHNRIEDDLYAAIVRQCQLEPGVIPSERDCDLGCWLHGDGRRRWAGNHTLLGLLEAHREFHAAVQTVADQVRRGQYAEARRALRAGGPFVLAKSNLTGAIRRMRLVCEAVAV